MSVIISQTHKPSEGAWYARNTVPELEIYATENVTIILGYKTPTAPSWHDTNIAFKGSYSPDSNNEIRIDFTGLFDSFVKTVIPDAIVSGATQYEAWYYFRLKVLDSEGTLQDTITWQVANAVLKSDLTFQQWTASHFLTNQPIEKPTTKESVEWLTWLDIDGNHELKARFYPLAGGEEEVSVKTDQAAGCFTENVSFSRIIQMSSLLPPELYGYYDLVLYDGKGEVLCSQRYIYKQLTGREHYFHIVNALGGVDTLICTGENLLQPEVAHNTGRFGDSYEELDDSDDHRKWRQQIGKVPHRWRDWIHELLSAKRGAAIVAADGTDVPIVLTESEVGISDHGQLGESSFEYILEDPLNAIGDAEYADDRYLHQSVADEADSMDGLAVSITVTFHSHAGSYETRLLSIDATRVFVGFDAPAQATTINYLLDGATAGSFNTGTDASPVVITKNANDTLQFQSQSNAVPRLRISYYRR